MRFRTISTSVFPNYFPYQNNLVQYVIGRTLALGSDHASELESQRKAQFGAAKKGLERHFCCKMRLLTILS